MYDSGDYTGFETLFAEDATFVVAGFPKAIQGREAIRALSAGWPAPALELEHREEWVVIDGNRLVFGWNERLGGAPPYRGISTFLFNEDGLITSYEGMFDTAAMAAATAP